MCPVADARHVDALADRWVHLIRCGERPAPHGPISARDGCRLKLVPGNERLQPETLRRCIQEVLEEMPHIRSEARQHAEPVAHLQTSGAGGRTAPSSRPCQSVRQQQRAREKAQLAWMRALAYLRAGNSRQALKDAFFSMSFSPQAQQISPCLETAADADAIQPPLCLWAPALEVAALALEARGMYPAAAMHMQQALDVCHRSDAGIQITEQSTAATTEETEAAGAATTTTTTETASAAAAAAGAAARSAYARCLERLVCRLTPLQKQALMEGQAQGLASFLEQERQDGLPEIRRSRPKLYYYERWMTVRVRAALPGLPEAVCRAMVRGLDAEDLDLMLTHRAGVMAQAAEMMAVMEQHGVQYLLEQYKPQRLTWEEVQMLAGPGMVGLPLGCADLDPGPAMAPPVDPSQEAYRRLLTQIAHELYQQNLTVSALLTEARPGNDVGAARIDNENDALQLSVRRPRDPFGDEKLQAVEDARHHNFTAAATTRLAIIKAAATAAKNAFVNST